MTLRRRIKLGTTIGLAVVLAGGFALLVVRAEFKPTIIAAQFSSATGVYAGDDVRVAGVKVGTIDSITPSGLSVHVVLKVDHDVAIPAGAKAVIVAENLVSSRYVQLTPAYRGTGPQMRDGAEIPLDRTSVPVEWDQVKEQLMRLATDLGPKVGSGGAVSDTSTGRFIDSAANALDGNGAKLRQTIAQLAGIGRILADGSGDIVSTIKNLQHFVSTLRDSAEQITAFQRRLASVSSTLDDSTADLDASLKDLSVAVVDVQRFIAGSRDQTSEQIQRLANVTQNLVDHKADVENVLHGAPNSIANGYNLYNPDTGTSVGSIVLHNFSSPMQFVCGAIGAVENATSTETAKLCADYLGPALRLLNFNYSPIPTNPYLAKSADPENLIYSDSALAPGGSGSPAGPPETPPAVSAYTGAGDTPAPPGFGQPPAVAPGISAPAHLPAAPSPAVYPGAPAPGPGTAGDLLLPATSGPLPAEQGAPAGGAR